MKRFTWWRMEQNPPHNAEERWCSSSSILHHVKRFMSHSPNSRSSRAASTEARSLFSTTTASALSTTTIVSSTTAKALKTIGSTLNFRKSARRLRTLRPQQRPQTLVRPSKTHPSVRWTTHYTFDPGNPGHRSDNRDKSEVLESALFETSWS